MKTCDGCGVDFDESMQLYPRLIISKEAKVARELAEKEGEEELCLSCWLEAVESLENRQLAMIIISLLNKVNALQQPKHPIFRSPPNNPPNSFPWGTTTTIPLSQPYVSGGSHKEPYYGVSPNSGVPLCSTQHVDPMTGRTSETSFQANPHTEHCHINFNEKDAQSFKDVVDNRESNDENRFFISGAFSELIK